MNVIPSTTGLNGLTLYERYLKNATVWCEFQAIRAQQDEQLRVKDIQV